jgi:serine-type D-Ala-D-Ala carboxypeptidase/endopeptidase (penicillin-binding protein 4)
MIKIYFSLFLLPFLFSCTAKKSLQKSVTINQNEAPLESIIKSSNADSFLQQTLSVFLKNPILSTAQVGVCIYDSTLQKNVIEHNANKLFVPASTTKLFTTYAALKYLEDSMLGVLYTPIGDGKFYVIGAADPTFFHPKFSTNKVYDLLNNLPSFTVVQPFKNNFNFLGKGWSWDDYDEAYLTERSSLPIYGNVVKFNWQEGKINVVPRYFSNKLNTITNHNFSRKLADNLFYVSEQKVKAKPLEVPFTQQDLGCLTGVLKDILPNCKNKFTIENIDVSMHSWKKIYSYPRDSVLKEMMYKSDNFLAEQLLLSISFNKLGYMNEGILIDSLLANDFRNLPQKPNWVDGSGLSRYNLQSPQNFVFLLNRLKGEFAWNKVSSILPTGNEGTLKNYYANYKNRFYAKTGSMGNTFSLCGYMQTNKNKKLTFSIILNNANQSNLSNLKLAVEKFISNLMDKY